jgi:hypothetical protein
MKTFVGIREVDEEVFREFRANAVRRKMKLGDAVSRAMKQWVERNRHVRREKLKVKPFDWGKGTENTSDEVDEILYGEGA